MEKITFSSSQVTNHLSQLKDNIHSEPLTENIIASLMKFQLMTLILTEW